MHDIKQEVYHINILTLHNIIFSATHLLSRPSPVQQGVNKGILIGYTTSGMPLYSFTSPQSVMATAKVFLRQVLAETESRQIFYFLCLNLVSDFSVVLIDLTATDACTLISTYFCVEGFHLRGAVLRGVEQ